MWKLIPSRFYDTEAVASADTTTEGTFGPVTIAPGTYRLLVRMDGVLADQEIEVAAGEDSFEVDVRIQSTRLTAVVREDGVPVPGGEVLLQRSADLRGNLGVAVARNPRVGTQFWSGRSGSDLTAAVNQAGVFSIDDVPAGRLVLKYFGQSGESVTRTIDVPDESEASLSIDIDGWRVQGRVDDAGTETGLEARVEMVDVHGTIVFQGSTQPSGEFSVDRVAPGIYNLVVSAEGYRTNDPVRVVVGNEALPPVRLRFGEGRRRHARRHREPRRRDPRGGSGDLDRRRGGASASRVPDIGGRKAARDRPVRGDGTPHLVGSTGGSRHVGADSSSVPDRRRSTSISSRART